MNDREHIVAIKKHLNEILGEECENMPTDEELDYDDDWINMYNALKVLKEAIETCGFL